MSRLDALCANPDLKPAVVTAMADRLQMHRNHLLLLRKETGQSFATILVSELRARKMGDEEILQTLRLLVRGLNRRPRPRPVLGLQSNVDHNSAGTFYSVIPEFGIDSAHAALVVDVPYYRVFESNSNFGGAGDVSISGFLRGRAAGLEFGSGVTVGAPTGDRSKGLGAGKATVDVSGTVAKRFEFVRPWISAGFANSVFNNVGYQRAYVTDGNVAHFSGGADFRLPRKLTAGVTGFGLDPLGNQSIFSQNRQKQQTPQPPGQTGGSGMGSGSGMGMGNGNGMIMPPVSGNSMQTMVNAGEVQDYGGSAWLSIPLHSGVSVTSAVSRSVPFHLTTVRISIGVDVARLLFAGKRF